MRPFPAKPQAPPFPRLLGLCGTLAGLAGCVSSSRPPSPPTPAASAPIVELNLLAMPTALNLDGQPGVDGVAVKVFAVQRGGSKASPIRTGSLEILAYSGTVETDPLPAAPFHSWTLLPSDLSSNQFTAALGTGYDLILSWAPKRLPNDRVTLIGRYLGPDAPPVLSPPNFVAAATL